MYFNKILFAIVAAGTLQSFAQEPVKDIAWIERPLMKFEDIYSKIGISDINSPEIDWDSDLKLSTNEIRTKVPVLSSSMYESQFHLLTGISLVRQSFDFGLQGNGDVVAQWWTSEDGMFEKIKLKDDLTWSDGRKLTADDVVFTYQLLSNPKVPATFYADQVRVIKSIHKVVDEPMTIVVEFSKLLANNLASLQFYITPRHVFAPIVAKDPNLYSEQFDKTPVTAGPYKVNGALSDSSKIVLERRKEWSSTVNSDSRPKPFFKKITLRKVADENTEKMAFDAKRADLIRGTFERVSSMQPSINRGEVNLTTTMRAIFQLRINWNIKVPLFADIRVRHALSYAIDYPYLLSLDKIHRQPTNSIYATTSNEGKAAKAKAFEFNLNKSWDLLMEAGWSDSNGDGVLDKVINGKRKDFEFSLTCPLPVVDTCDSVRESLGRLGITVNVRPTDFASLVERQNEGRFQALVIGWSWDLDPSTYREVFGEDGVFAKNGYVNNGVTELFKKAEEERDPIKASEYYGELSDLLWKDQPFTVLYEGRSSTLTHPGIKGLYDSYTSDAFPGVLGIWRAKQ